MKKAETCGGMRYRARRDGVGEFGDRVAAVVRGVPAGRVASYGDVAAAAGRPGAARAVGRALRSLPDGSDVPWWRVINGRGVVSIPRSGLAAGLQRTLLEGEGIEFDEAGRVDMTRFGWRRRDPADD
jgi:methylated-DNA-protein-cysteine methyltransferase related protein